MENWLSGSALSLRINFPFTPGGEAGGEPGWGGGGGGGRRGEGAALTLCVCEVAPLLGERVIHLSLHRSGA